MKRLGNITGKNPLIILFTAIFLTVVLVYCMRPAHATPPLSAISYQGYLKNADGTPVNSAVTVTFRVYSTTGGTTPLWSGAPQSITPQNGIFGTRIGPVSLPFDRQYYLGVSFGTDTEMAPRQAMTAVPYALHATTADNAVTFNGLPASSYVASGTNSNITSLSGLNDQAAITVAPFGTSAGATSEIRLRELAANGSNYVGFKAPDSIPTNHIWTLPPGDGTANQVLRTDGAGRLSWSDVNSSSIQSVTGTDPSGVIKGTNSATQTSGYLGGAYGVYGTASGNNSAAVSGVNSTPDNSSQLGYGVKGQSGASVGVLGMNRVCTDQPYECNCDWDSNIHEMVCDTCYQSVCDEKTGAGVYGKGTAPLAAGIFDGDVRISGGVTLLSPSGVFTGNGSGLTNVTASNLNINCAEGQILKKGASGWQCSAPCQIGDAINCYDGPVNTVNVGTCKAGLRFCGSTGYGVCSGQVLPAAETCTGIDANCNGVVNDAQPGAVGCTTFYHDKDGDGKGTPAETICACTQPVGYVTNSDDCNDNNASIPNQYLLGYVYETSSSPGSSPPSWDYNCDGIETREFLHTTGESCVVINNTCQGGWVGSTVPACGVTAQYRACTPHVIPNTTIVDSCTPTYYQQTQACR